MAAQQTKGQWTGQAQTKIPLQMAGISSALSPLATMAGSLARKQPNSPLCESLFLLNTEI